MNKKCDKCNAELQEAVKLGHFEDLEKTNEYIANFVSQLIICETCFERDKEGYWIKYKHIIKETKTKDQTTKNYLKLCGHIGDACFTYPSANTKKCWRYCEKIFPPKYCDNKECPSSGIKGLATQQEYNAGKCNKCQGEQSKSASGQLSTTADDTHEEKPKGMSGGTIIIIIGVVLLVLAGIGYAIYKWTQNKKDHE